MRDLVIILVVAAAALVVTTGARAQPRGMDAGVVAGDAGARAVVADAGPGSDAQVSAADDAAAATEDDGAAAPDSRDAEAHALYFAGRAALAGGRFADARGHFVRAWELTGRPFLLYEIGRACDLLRRDAEALAAFRRYLHEVPDAPNRDEVRGRVEVLRRSVALAHDDATASASTTATSAPPQRAHRIGGPTVLETWWFWAIVGTVTVATVAIAITVLTNAATRPPISGDLPPGSVIEALESP